MTVRSLNVSEIDRKIDELDKEIVNLKLRKAAIKKMSASQRLAVTLRERHFNTRDDSWYYEISADGHEWHRVEHIEFSMRAQRLLLYVDGWKTSDGNSVGENEIVGLLDIAFGR